MNACCDAVLHVRLFATAARVSVFLCFIALSLFPCVSFDVLRAMSSLLVVVASCPTPGALRAEFTLVIDAETNTVGLSGAGAASLVAVASCGGGAECGAVAAGNARAVARGPLRDLVAGMEPDAESDAGPRVWRGIVEMLARGRGDCAAALRVLRNASAWRGGQAIGVTVTAADIAPM